MSNPGEGVEAGAYLGLSHVSTYGYSFGEGSMAVDSWVSHAYLSDDDLL